MIPTLGQLIINPIADSALQTLSPDSSWYLMIEGMQMIFPWMIDICFFIIIAVAIISVFKS
ncbi:MAG: hypothetical protein IKV78_04895 [Methanocorpusculum sp.]|nr:hypothetical protein [Methanocorpusculum sp.]